MGSVNTLASLSTLNYQQLKFTVHPCVVNINKCLMLVVLKSSLWGGGERFCHSDIYMKPSYNGTLCKSIQRKILLCKLRPLSSTRSKQHDELLNIKRN